jgi:hypothetical protein
MEVTAFLRGFFLLLLDALLWRIIGEFFGVVLGVLAAFPVAFALEGRPLVASGRVGRERSRVRAAHRGSDGAAALDRERAAPSSNPRAARTRWRVRVSRSAVTIEAYIGIGRLPPTGRRTLAAWSRWRRLQHHRASRRCTACRSRRRSGRAKRPGPVTAPRMSSAVRAGLRLMAASAPAVSGTWSSS